MRSPSILALVSGIAAAAFSFAVGCEKPPGSPYVAEAGPITRPAGPMTRERAEAYVVALVNHDRAQAGLAPVEWDQTAAHAALGHVEDMTAHGYTAHYGTDGSVPEQRYTAAGGVHMVQENAACFFDGVARPLDPSPTFTAVDLEKIEGAFMSEVPPSDGHKKNILKKWHNKLGVGLAKPVGIAQACLVQEFVDEYGTYDPIPKRAKRGAVVRVAGELRDPVKFGGVGFARIDPAHPRTASDLNGTSTYPIPEPYVLYFPAGYQTPKPVTVNGNRFTIDVPLSDAGRAGRYEVSVWGNYPGDKALVIVGLRVVDVE